MDEEEKAIIKSEPGLADLVSDVGSDLAQLTVGATSDEPNDDATAQLTKLKITKATIKGKFTKCRRKLLNRIGPGSASNVEEIQASLDELSELYDMASGIIADVMEITSDLKQCDKLADELEKLDYEFSAAMDKVQVAVEVCQRQRVEAYAEAATIPRWPDWASGGEPSEAEELEEETPTNVTFTVRSEATPVTSTTASTVLTSAPPVVQPSQAVAVSSASMHVSDTSGSSLSGSVGVSSTTANSSLSTSTSVISAASNTIMSASTSNATRSTGQSRALLQQQPPVAGLQAGARPYIPMASRSAGSVHQPSVAAVPVTAGVSRQGFPSSTANPWTHMQKISIPTFEGDKRRYEAWWAAFSACVDDAPVTAECKMLRLRQYLRGEPLRAIDELGYSASAYAAAKALLTRKYGGERRKIARHVEALQSFERVGLNRPAEFEKFTELLEVAVVNLKDGGRAAELEAGTFYQQLLKKFDERLLAQYHRWRMEKQYHESVNSLLEWARLEAELLIISSETVHGMKNNNTSTAQQKQSYQKPPQERRNRTFHVVRSSDSACPACQGSHPLWKCMAFKALPVSRRWQMAKLARACYRCLGSGHAGKDCTRGMPCGVSGCTAYHHRLLHSTDQTNATGTTSSSGAPGSTSTSSSSVTEGERHATHVSCSEPARVALRTVPVLLSNGPHQVVVNALLDDASTVSYVSKSIATRLHLNGIAERTTISTVNGRTDVITTIPVTVKIHSMDGSVEQTVRVLATPGPVTGDLQAIEWIEMCHGYPHLKEIPFRKIAQPATVDMLIGSDNVTLHTSIKEVPGDPGQPVARLTPLGWTCVGRITSPPVSDKRRTHLARTYMVSSRPSMADADRALQRFWEVDNSGLTNEQPALGPVSAAEAAALSLAEQTTKLVDGRYQVQIPWNDRKAELVPNVGMAMKRLENTIRRLSREPDVAAAYSDVIQQYATKGYIREVTNVEDLKKPCWYLPHFAIVRPQKTTTKVRIVFDAAARDNGVCLNDAINAGPKLQQDLCNVLTRFRHHAIGVTCDVAEMYLQVEIAPEDRPFHRFLWQDPINGGRVKHFEFTRLVFGVNASPFLAQYVSRRVAEAARSSHPLGAAAILESTYMDDTMDSAATVPEAQQLHGELVSLWGEASMYPRKWLSNSAELLDAVPAEDRAADVDLAVGDLPAVKTLGIIWSARDDEFTFRIQEPKFDKPITKRYFLQQISTVFDPLGFIAPFIIRGKMIMQDCWLNGTDWDEPLEAATAVKAIQWFQELHDLTAVKVPRQLEIASGKLELHTFCDASTTAYGAVVYVRTIHANQQATVRLAASKSRVAPLSATSVPRLELMAAVLGTQVTQHIANVLGTPMEEITYWSDSTTVLQWVRSYSRRFKPFVANRISQIQSRSAPERWRHVSTSVNPADLVSRGTSVSELATSRLWWQGPEFLTDGTSLPEANVPAPTSLPEERKSDVIKQQSYLANAAMEPTRYSSWTRLARVAAWVNRFINNCRRAEQVTGELSCSEIEAARVELIVNAQMEAFGDDIRRLKKGSPIPTTSRLAKMCPRLDDNGLLRCDGRVKLADWLPYDMRFPIILPRKHHVTSLIVRDHHEQRQHGGTNETLAALSRQYWLEAGREEIRAWESQCMVCRRRKARTADQVMAPLPKSRLATPLRAFARCAVDYGGPYLTKQGRGRSQAKRYLCLFTCLLTRAVHLELSYGLDSDSFLNAFSRMASRRGLPIEIISDNGTNFVAADRELRELVDALDDEQVTRSLANRGVTWRFNPPSAPHFGGVHEVMIRAAKRAIKSILGNAEITDEQLTTALVNAEGLINSRPLTYQSSNPADYSPLTPNHFIMGQLGGQFAPESVDTEDYHHNKRWRHVQELVRQFWRRWLAEWVPTLNVRRKWTAEKRDVAVGDVVLVLQPDSPRGHWPLGRVVSTLPGPDGHVRVVEVRVGDRVFKRAITKICPLDV